MAIDVSVPLYGKVALVTGATSGIGLAAARLLASNGADVAFNGFADAEDIERIEVEICGASTSKVRHFPHDLADFDQATRLVADVLGEFGRVDILVNNAGVQHVAAIDVFPDAEWHRLLAVNLSASFATVRAVWPGMKARGWGRIVNTASTLALTAETRKAAYVASKHGVLGLTREVALEGATLGITSNAICPAWVLTPLVSLQVEAKALELGCSFTQAAEQHFLADIPTRRFVEPSEVAAAILFLCSDAARSITGIALPVDGASLVL